MKKFLYLLIFLLAFGLVVTGCSTKGKTTTKDKQSLEQGNVTVWLEGEVQLDKEQITVKGQSNLLSESKVDLQLKTDDQDIYGSGGTVQVAKDGSFQLAVKKPKGQKIKQVQVIFKPELQNNNIKAHYGKKGEKLKGAYVYQYENSDRKLYKMAMAKVALPQQQDKPTKVALEKPQQDKPKDFGQTKIWIKTDIKKESGVVKLAGKSNILEGGNIHADLKIAGKIYTYDNARVNPDGTFNLTINNTQNKDLKGAKVVITFETRPDDWESIKSAYGEKGEKLQGDLVKEYKMGDQSRKRVEYTVDIEK